jgi:hypothetical protein
MNKKVQAIAALGILSVAHTALAANEKQIRLRFTPKENVTANVPVLEGASAAHAIEIQPLVDARGLADLSLVGENREKDTPRPVHATTSVAEFSTQVLRTCLTQWGVRVEPGALTLSGEIANLFVTEENTYSTQISVRFRLSDAAGNVLWQGVATGGAHQFGRSMSEENYNEQISDALKQTYANLLSNAGFQAAWAGKASGAKAASPSDVKASILKMMGQNIDTGIIVGYVRGVSIDPALGPDDIVDWKTSGIPDEVLKAAVVR